MECFAIEPDAIDSSSKRASLLRVQQSAVDTTGALPLLERVYLFPAFCDSPDVDDCLHQRETERGGSNEMGRLAGVVCYKLDDIFKRAIGSVQC